MRGAFLSQLAFQTYSGYVASQFKKIEADLRLTGDIKWKHAMHLIRLLLLGVDLMRTGTITLAVGGYYDRLMRIRAGQMEWQEVEAWRLELHRQFEDAFKTTALPERPDYEAVNAFLVRARRSAVTD